jgi:Fic family protein
MTKAGQKSPKASGTWRNTGRGYKAFYPNPLPPVVNWTPGLIRAMSDADSRLGKLAGEGGRLPNPYLLIRPFVQREAVHSSRIEGTQSTLGELLAADAGAAVTRSPDDLREVGNYVIALEYGLQRLKSLPLSLRLVRELHAKLMKGARGYHAAPGDFRVSQNWIGEPGCTLAQASYVPPPHDEMMDHLSHWEKFLHDDSLPPLAQAALMHYQFEAIHPFLDGNGRVGRLLIIILLCKREVLPLPLLYLSAFFEATRRDYYDRIRAVTERGEWERWLQYFFNGVARQAEDAVSRAERINALLEKWRVQASADPTTVAARLLDVVASNPYLTPRGAEKSLDVAYNTAVDAIRRLELRGILQQVGSSRRGRVFCAKGILDILEEPTRLKPIA